MKPTIFYCLLFLLLIGSPQLHAQCRDNRYEVLDGNQVSARFNNGANYFWDMSGTSAYEVPKGSGLTPNFATGIWIGGLDAQDQLHLAASTYRQQGWDYYAGPYRRPGAVDCLANIETSDDVFLRGVKLLSNGKVLILTGVEVIIYDPNTEQSIQRPLPTARVWADALELPDGRILIYGDNAYPIKNPILYMDTTNYAITGGPTLNWFQYESTANILNNGKVLFSNVVGCEVLDPSTNISTPVPDMLYPRNKHAAVKLDNGDIYACGGGASLNGTGSTNRTQYFDDSLGYWFPGPVMSVGRQRTCAVKLPDGRIFIMGGSLTSKNTDIYDPQTGLMSRGPDLPAPAFDASMVLLDSQQVLISAQPAQGGINSQFMKLNFVTGAVENLKFQVSYNRLTVLDPETGIMAFHDYRHLYKVKFPTSVINNAPWQEIWKLNRSDIDAFRADFASGNVDFSRYPDIASWPAHGNEGLGEDRNLAPFIDVNLDGRYRPAVDGDYPCIVGDQALWWIYNDQGPHNESGGRQIGAQVEMMAYAVDCQQTACPDTTLDYTVFMHFEVTNQSDTAYHSMRIGLLDDIDLGNYGDDFVGSDTALNLAYGYNGLPTDQNYGAIPPAFGSLILPNAYLPDMGTMMYYDNTFSTVNGNPQTPENYYNYLNHRWLDALPLVNNGIDGYPNTAPGPPVHAIYSGTEGFCGGPLVGWSEVALGNTPFDRRYLQASDTFSLQPGQSTQWDIAYVFAKGTDHLNSVCQLKTASQAISNWWVTQLDRGCFDLLVHRDAPRSEGSFKVVPNPASNGLFKLSFPSALAESGTLDLIDLQGRRLMRQALDLGMADFPVNAGGLAAGVYLLKVQVGADVQTKRLILQ